MTLIIVNFHSKWDTVDITGNIELQYVLLYN